MGYKLVVSLSLAQIEHRRYLLNQAGFIAWLSPILILTITYFCRRLLPGASVSPSSKRLKPITKRPSPFVLLYRQLSWIFAHTYPPTSEFGPLGVLILALIYAAWLLFLAFRNTNDDYMHLTKALGHVAVSQLPLHYLLSIKSPQSPITLATGLTHERLNDFHRIFGRIVHVLLAAHAVMYLNFFIKLGVLDQRIKSSVVRLGLAAFWSTNFLGIFALPMVRRRLYHRLFYRSHVVLSAALLVAIWFHVPYTRWYVAQAGAFWIANGLVRWRASSGVVSARVENLEGTELVRLRIPIRGTSDLNDFVPGQHVYVKRASSVLGPKTPFTIVGVVPDGEDGAGNPMSSVELVVRNLGGPQTGWLAVENSISVILEGPYGEASEYVPALLRDRQNAGPVLLVAGGVGATYTIPIYKSLLERRGPYGGVSLIWIVPSLRDARWGIEMLGKLQSAVNADIYVTKDEDVSGTVVEITKEGLKVHTLGKRPEMKIILDNVFSTSLSKKGGKATKKDYSRVNVLICGPSTLSEALRREVGKHVLAYGRDVRLHEEQFGLGSS